MAVAHFLTRSMGSNTSTECRREKTLGNSAIDARRLAEEEAWAVATAWKKQLRDCGITVFLTIDRDRLIDSLIESYAWVRIELPHTISQRSPCQVATLSESALVARAAALTWHALSRCSGFTGLENPIFWKRVFSDLGPRRANVLDSVGFFDQLDNCFPRIMIAMQGRPAPHQIATVLSCFCGTYGAEKLASTEVQTKLAHLLASLQPWQTVIGSKTTVDVGLSVSPAALVELSSESLLPIRSEDVVPTVANLEQPSFRLVHLLVDGLMKFDDDGDVATFTRFMQRSLTPIGHLQISSHIGRTTRYGMAQALHCLLQQSSEISSSLEFQHSRLDDITLPALFSAIPHASSIHSLSLSVREENRSFATRELPWLAFAVFHPFAQQSSLRHLILRDIHLSREVVSSLAAMSRGNNLLQLLTGKPPDCDAYYRGHLAYQAVIRVEPSPGAAEIPTASDVDSFEIDLCGVHSLDRTTWGSWVAVVVPAHGLGWVKSSSIRSAREFAPVPSQLTGLRLLTASSCSSRINSTTRPASDFLRALISFLGSNLTLLDITACGDVSQMTVAALVAACPSLRSLAVNHGGDMRESHGALATLSELSLTLPSHGKMIMCSDQKRLDNLSAIRICSANPDALGASSAFLRNLLHSAPNLRYLHWRDESVSPSEVSPTPPMPTFESAHEESLRLVRRLGIPPAQSLFADGPFTATCAAALLSVVESKQREFERGKEVTSAIRGLSNDVLGLICSFATSRVRRVVCLECNSKR